MTFETWQAAWYMVGHGAYVWGAYGLTALVLATLVWLPIARARRARRRILAEARRFQSTQVAVSPEVADAS